MAWSVGSERGFVWRRIWFLVWLFCCIRFGAPMLMALKEDLRIYGDLEQTIPRLCGVYPASSPDYADCHRYFVEQVQVDILRDGLLPAILAIGIPLAVFGVPFLLRRLRRRGQGGSTAQPKVVGNGKRMGQGGPVEYGSHRYRGESAAPTVVRPASMRETMTLERRV